MLDLLKNPEEFDNYVRKVLGQTVFPTSTDKYKGHHEYNGSDNWNNNHLRFNYDIFYWHDNDANKEIIEKFDALYGDKKVIIQPKDDDVQAIIVNKKDYYKYNYWFETTFGYCELPHKMCIEYNKQGTVDIIKDIIKGIHTGKYIIGYAKKNIYD